MVDLKINRSLFQPLANKSLTKNIVTIKNFAPDLVLLGHVFNIDDLFLYIVVKQYKNVLVSWNSFLQFLKEGETIF